jgi:hypothetical protein
MSPKGKGKGKGGKKTGNIHDDDSMARKEKAVEI